MFGSISSLANKRGAGIAGRVRVAPGPPPGARFSPLMLPNVAAWFRFGQGITVTGAGVSQWDDASGNARHLLQGTDANRPPKQADGSILFDGVAHFLKSAPFALAQPETVYLLIKQITWTANDAFADGIGAANRMVVEQKAGGVSPEIDIYAGAFAATNSGLAVGAYGVVAAVFNGAASLVQVNTGAPVVGDPLAQGGGGLTIGASYVPGNFSNIQLKEVIIYAAAHDAATRARVITYLNAL